MWTILRWERTVAATALQAMGVDCDDFSGDVDIFLKQPSRPNVYADPLKTARDWARRESSIMGSAYCGSEHLLLGAIANAMPDFRFILASHQIEYARCTSAVAAVLGVNGPGFGQKSN
jgi:hypothetical protein